MIDELGLGSIPCTGVFRDSLNNEICESTEAFLSNLLVLSKSALRLSLAELFLPALDRERLLLDVTRPTAVPPTRPIMNKIVRSISITFHLSEREVSRGFAHTSIAKGLTLAVSLRLVDGRDLIPAPSAEDYEETQLSRFA